MKKFRWEYTGKPQRIVLMKSDGGGGGGGTQRAEPPTYLEPHLRAGTDLAARMYAQGGPQQYGGNTVVPFSAQTERAMQGIEGRALAGSPVSRAANQYAYDALSGKHVNANPWLDQMYDRAAQQTRRQLDTQFATAGRDIEAQYPARADALNNLATNIYGGAYENERNRQQGVLPMAPTLAQQDYFDMQQLMGVGGNVENLASQYQQDAQRRWDFEQMRPEMATDQYLSRIAGSPANNYGNQIVDTDRNRLAGAAGGALGGWALGSSLTAPGAALAGASMWPFALGGALLGGWL